MLYLFKSYVVRIMLIVVPPGPIAAPSSNMAAAFRKLSSLATAQQQFFRSLAAAPQHPALQSEQAQLTPATMILITINYY